MTIIVEKYVVAGQYFTFFDILYRMVVDKIVLEIIVCIAVTRMIFKTIQEVYGSIIVEFYGLS